MLPQNRFETNEQQPAKKTNEKNREKKHEIFIEIDCLKIRPSKNHTHTKTTKHENRNQCILLNGNMGF